MASRLPLIIKKRGARRTGARWPGLVGEGLVCAALIAAGGYGLYWLINQVAYAEDSGWWHWLAMIIPLALIVYGCSGLVALLWRNAASSERRAAVVQKATDWEALAGAAKPARPALPAVPPIDAVIDSPGVKLAYRLPIDAASGWVSFTMAAVCLAWNTLVVIFVVQVVRHHMAGRPNWLLTWLMVPFVLAGLWTLVALARQVLLNIAIGTTRVELSHHPLYPGGTFQGYVSQTGRLHVRWLQVQLVCEEQAVYQQGTDARRATSRVYRATAFSQRKFDITPQQPFEASFSFTIPATAMHSFVSAHNGVTWSLAIRGRMARWGDFERRFPIYVYPLRVMQQEVLTPLSTTARSWPA
jgi:hypothetical protein